MIQVIGNSPVLASGERIPISPAIRAGDYLFLSGQLGMDDQGRVVGEDIESQTRQCMKRLEAVLALAGADRSQIIKVNVWLTHKADFPAFNGVYRELFAERPPARSTVISELLIPGARVEIDAVAYLPR